MIRIADAAEWEHLLRESNKNLLLVFKHSTRCPISDMAFMRMEEGESEAVFPIPLRLVLVPEQRELSNRIALDLGVKHESPQVIVIKDGRAVFNASHERVSPENVRMHL